MSKFEAASAQLCCSGSHKFGHPFFFFSVVESLLLVISLSVLDFSSHQTAFDVDFFVCLKLFLLSGNFDCGFPGLF